MSHFFGVDMTEVYSLELPIENDATLVVLYVRVMYNLPEFPLLQRIRPFMHAKLRVYPSSERLDKPPDWTQSSDLDRDTDTIKRLRIQQVYYKDLCCSI